MCSPYSWSPDQPEGWDPRTRQSYGSPSWSIRVVNTVAHQRWQGSSCPLWPFLLWCSLSEYSWASLVYNAANNKWWCTLWSKKRHKKFCLLKMWGRRFKIFVILELNSANKSIRFFTKYYIITLALNSDCLCQLYTVVFSVIPFWTSVKSNTLITYLYSALRGEKILLCHATDKTRKVIVTVIIITVTLFVMLIQRQEQK